MCFWGVQAEKNDCKKGETDAHILLLSLLTDDGSISDISHGSFPEEHTALGLASSYYAAVNRSLQAPLTSLPLLAAVVQ